MDDALQRELMRAYWAREEARFNILHLREADRDQFSDEMERLNALGFRLEEMIDTEHDESELRALGTELLLASRALAERAEALDQTPVPSQQEPFAFPPDVGHRLAEREQRIQARIAATQAAEGSLEERGGSRRRNAPRST